jgi:hypothetical protein
VSEDQLRKERMGMDHETPQGQVTTYVPGSSFQAGDTVVVVDDVDPEIHNVVAFIGRRGIVRSLNYDCGCGQEHPDDPMIMVEFTNGDKEEFWPEELHTIHLGKLWPLQELIEKCRGHVMTKSEFRAQMVSFTYGNLVIDDPTTTREACEKACDELLASDPSILERFADDLPCTPENPCFADGCKNCASFPSGSGG